MRPDREFLKFKGVNQFSQIVTGTGFKKWPEWPKSDSRSYTGFELAVTSYLFYLGWCLSSCCRCGSEQCGLGCGRG